MPSTVVVKFVVEDSQLIRAKTRAQEAQKATDDLRKSTGHLNTDFQNAGSEGQKAFNQIGAAVKAISFVLIAKELFDFTKQVVAVRGEFQKFEAVLTNTLGSRSAALMALGRISEFAKTTPYGVRELTESFVKLANRGVEPTLKQMRAIADLAATLGKDYAQVVEAILDINNPERWKEIGVKAETAGSKVRLSFRGVTEEVDRTVEGVTSAIVALGQLNGVAGSTEAISRTLTGQTSNLKDAWDQLLNTIGKGNEGVLFEAVGLLSRAVDKANELVKGDAQKFDELMAKTLAAESDGFQKLVAAFGGDVDKARAAFDKKVDERIIELNERFKRIRDSMETSLIGDVGVSARNKARQDEMDRLSSLINIYMQELPGAIDETLKKTKEKTEADLAAAEAAKKKAAADREAELAERRRSGAIVKPDKKTGEDFLEELKLVIGDTQKIEGPIEVQVQPVVPMDNWDKFNDAWGEQWRGFLSQGIDDFSSFLVGTQEAEAESLQARIRSTEDFYRDQQLLAGDNERVKKELRIKEEREVIALQRKMAIAEWEAKRTSIILSTAGGVARAFIDYQWPYALIPAAAVAAEGGVQLAVADKNRPRFAEGVINLKGPGTETSDSIDAKLSRGESVMTAKQTREAFGILTDVRAGRLNDRIIKQIVNNGGTISPMDDSRIVSELQSIKKGQYKLEEQAGLLYRVYGDENGSKKRIRSRAMGY